MPAAGLATSTSARIAPGTARRGRGECTRGARGVRAPRRALEANKDWPPEDVWEDFARAHEGEYVGVGATFDGKTGACVPLEDRYVPEAFKEYGVGVNDWQIRTRGAMTADGDGVRLETTRFWPEAGCEFGKSDAAKTETVDVCAGGQMGKMFIVQGCYADGPMLLPECVEGAEMKFYFAFVEDEAPNERRRVELRVRAAPGKKRNWELVDAFVTHEVLDGSNVRPQSPATSGEIMPEDAVVLGNWRADSGVTFITLEALSEVPEDRDENAEEVGPAQKLAEEKPNDAALAKAAEAEKAAKIRREKEAKEAAARAPEGIIVVPWWAVKSPSSWAQGGEYIVGGNSPLIFLPGNIWVLVESVDDQLVLECGRYDGGLPGPELADVERRVIARRYRKGRFASAFFVRERQLDSVELEEEKDEFDIWDEEDGLLPL